MLATCSAQSASTVHRTESSMPRHAAPMTTLEGSDRCPLLNSAFIEVVQNVLLISGYARSVAHQSVSERARTCRHHMGRVPKQGVTKAMLLGQGHVCTLQRKRAEDSEGAERISPVWRASRGLQRVTARCQATHKHWPPPCARPVRPQRRPASLAEHTAG